MSISFRNVNSFLNYAIEGMVGLSFYLNTGRYDKDKENGNPKGAPTNPFFLRKNNVTFKLNGDFLLNLELTYIIQ